jgi:hypothetical protein
VISEAEYTVLRDRMAGNCLVRGPLETIKATPQKRRGRMNKLEARYQREILEPDQQHGVIRWFEFEPIKLRLADGAWFTPDFGFLDAMGEIGFVEVKGFWREAARLRIKVAADRYPFPFLAATRDKKTGEWQHEHFRGRA